LGLLRLLIFLGLQLCIDYIIQLRGPGDIPRHTHASASHWLQSNVSVRRTI